MAKATGEPQAATQQTPTNRIAEAASEPGGDPFVGRWNQLVSTTNWEKGQIICAWRESLMAAGAEAAEYSDDAWAQLVGGVTGQHVGRLRRVYQRFGDVFERFEGVYWSHFHAGIDWEDAEMWLEGAVQNNWSVSQMRGKRWETVGTPGETPPPEEASALEADEEDAAPIVVDESAAPVANVDGDTPTASAANADEAEQDTNEEEESSEADASPEPAAKSARLNVAVDDLPDDLADAFEQFKLAIIANRRSGWNRTTPETVLDCLDALKQLTLAEA